MSCAIFGRPMKLTGTPAAAHAPPMKQPTEPAPRIAILSAATIRRDALVGQPQAIRRRAGLPENVDRNSPARIQMPPEAQPLRLHRRDQALADADGHILVEAAVVAE